MQQDEGSGRKIACWVKEYLAERETCPKQDNNPSQVCVETRGRRPNETDMEVLAGGGTWMLSLSAAGDD
jgi:hypothetical protein